MAENQGLRRYLKAGMTITEVTRTRAEDLLRDLVKTGEIERHKAQGWVGDVVRTSRERSGAFVTTVVGEVRKPLQKLGFTNGAEVAETRRTSPSRSSAAPRKVTARPAKNVPAAKTVTRRTPTTKVGAKKTAKRMDA